VPTRRQAGGQAGRQAGTHRSANRAALSRLHNANAGDDDNDDNDDADYGSFREEAASARYASVFALSSSSFSLCTSSRVSQRLWIISDRRFLGFQEKTRVERILDEAGFIPVWEGNRPAA